MGQRDSACEPAPSPAVVHKHRGRPLIRLLLLALPGGLHERLVRAQPLLDRPLKGRSKRVRVASGSIRSVRNGSERRPEGFT